MDKVASPKGLPSKNSPQSIPKKLNRFTSIDRMFEIISKNELRMSDPKYWEDKNDVFFLNQYKVKVGIKSLFALCFLCELETIYHWGAFSDKLNACCIEFDACELIGSIYGDKCFRNGKVNYIKIENLKEELKDVKDIPFSKRFPYRNESEYRIIFESEKPMKEKKITIQPSMVKLITINWHISKVLFEIIKKEIEGNYKISVNRSTVIKNEEWINYVKRMEPNMANSADAKSRTAD